MDSSQQQSIRQLLDDLCKSIYRDCTQTHNGIAHQPAAASSTSTAAEPPESLLRRCRQNAYAILLKKTNKVAWPDDLLATDDGFSEHIDPMRELRYCQFVHNVRVGQERALADDNLLADRRRRREILEKFELFGDCIDVVESAEYFRPKNEGHKILTFLLLLKNSSVDDGRDHGADESLFALNTQTMPELPKMAPAYFQLNWNPSEYLAVNPYCDSMLKLESSTDVLNGTVAEAKSDIRRIDKNVIYSEAVGKNHKKRLSGGVHHTSHIWKHAGLQIPLDGSAGSGALLESLVEKKFLTEKPSAGKNAATFVTLKNGDDFRVHVRREPLLIEHIKLLLVGIESDSFRYDSMAMAFSMVDHLATDNVLPASVGCFVEEAIECGTCYKRLKYIIDRSTEKTNEYQGFLFKVRLESI